MRVKNTTHTPGPWARETGDEADTRIISIPELHKGPLWVIADMASCDTEQHNEQRANARLIAAAPELLAALKLIEGVANSEAWAIEEVSNLCADNYAATEEGVIDRIRRAAIAKAEGK